MRTVYLIGVNHKWQLGLNSIIPVVDATAEDFEEFRHLLRTTVTCHGVRGIAEEMSVDALKRQFVEGDSVPCSLAAETCLPHRYCDPGIEIQQNLNIKTDQEREKYWLEQIISFDLFPLLFIVGACHINSFQSLLTVSGLQPFIVERDWKASSSPEPAA